MVSSIMITRHRIASILLRQTSVSSPLASAVPLLAPSGSTITLTTVTTALPFNGTARRDRSSSGARRHPSPQRHTYHFFDDARLV